jgi:hypothetical protein
VFHLLILEKASAKLVHGLVYIPSFPRTRILCAPSIPVDMRIRFGAGVSAGSGFACSYPALPCMWLGLHGKEAELRTANCSSGWRICCLQYPN